MSRLITNPNPGTSVFPFGTSCCVDVLVVVSFDCVVDVSDVVVAVGVISCAGEGGTSKTIGVGATFIVGFIGLIGLVGFVAFDRLFTHVICVSVQGPTTGCAYGVGQVEICCCVINPTYPL
jgi:hypothetical protein